MHWIINVFVSVIVFVQSLVGGSQTVTPIVTSNVVVSTTTQTTDQSAGSVQVKTLTKVVQDGIEGTPIESQTSTNLPPDNSVPPVINVQVPSIVVQQNQISTKEPLASTPAPLDCTPTLQASLTQFGDISTGIDFTFNGTTTFPGGCLVDKNMEIDLQTPTVKYRGKESEWKRSESIKEFDGGFTYQQGWGTGSGVTPSGSFIWYVGATSTEVKI